jgi:hypothetical protein
MTPKPARAGRRYHPGSPFQAPVLQPVEQYAVGDRVTHDRHGLGSVICVEEETGVLVDFGSKREWITTPYSKLSKL